LIAQKKEEDDGDGHDRSSRRRLRGPAVVAEGVCSGDESGGCRSLVSQGVNLPGKAAEIAGLTRREFLEALFREQVPACQVTIEELAEELKSWPASSGEASTPLP